MATAYAGSACPGTTDSYYSSTRIRFWAGALCIMNKLKQFWPLYVRR